MFSGGQPGTSMPRCRPICASTSLISLSDLRPKFGVRSISASRLLHEVADVDDVVVLQAVGRAHRQLELVHLLEEGRVEREVRDRLGAPTSLRGSSKFTNTLSWSCRMRAAYASASSGVTAPLVSICMRQLVVVEDLAFAGVLDAVRHLAHRRVEAVDRDQADRRVFRDGCARPAT